MKLLNFGDIYTLFQQCVGSKLLIILACLTGVDSHVGKRPSQMEHAMRKADTQLA